MGLTGLAHSTCVEWLPGLSKHAADHPIEIWTLEHPLQLASKTHHSTVTDYSN